MRTHQIKHGHADFSDLEAEARHPKHGPLPEPVIKRFGVVEYEPALKAMQRFTELRQEDTPDQIWLLQHPPVFTLGLNGKPEHLLHDLGIPVIKVDRGGQITYHGPGQLVVYLLLDLKRLHLGVRDLVRRMEHAVIELLANFGVAAQGREDAPGVYVHEAKVAALGLRVKRGCTYHGLALNVDMDLKPFAAINPCGYEGLAVTQLKDLGIEPDLPHIAEQLLKKLLKNLY
ncbi:lipoyl(octanoyl) transferase [uncultured bacterium]|jgi:lipoyl(octanoyl) transferase|nr:MAG: lipoyl(octanoyl) transferase LipB [Burkholderiales bacterium]CAG1065287.1 lipoyl(octanoyl) transferase [uncultured bacterium]